MAFLSGAPTDPQVFERTSFRSIIRILYTDSSQTFNIAVPAGTYVEEVYATVTEVCDGTPTLKLGDSADDDGYLTSAQIAPGTAATTTTPAVIRASSVANPFRYGKRYPTADNVTCTWVKGTSPTTGAIEVVVVGFTAAKLGVPAAIASTATL